ncbi:MULTISPECIES: BlaI/MecI/CopY family transcriptional regulator [Acidobacteriaceae]|uniref:BlaI/MecI/CopY family transcriptional regulator n=1 Tax=Acidobacteriaceae TaxID=204434 RepID=UPI00131CCCDC|nr:MULTISPECIES: BlaI/MecI/CopY family transcriptional regulator [Acidobacteriaceae]MDW5264177.1 BlaI/MecI/CopY family transcriptional regulator [Edaphobacter sp.]
MVGRKKGTNALTPLELQILQVLWSEGAGNVQHVQKGLLPSNELAYNTVQTMLNVLHRKGRVERALEGRAFVYSPVASKETVLGQAVRDLVERMFGGSSEALVMSLVKSRQVDLERIADLSRKIAAEERGEEDE